VVSPGGRRADLPRSVGIGLLFAALALGQMPAPARGGATAASGTAPLPSRIAPSAYYRPVIRNGRAFPLVRSNRLSLIQIQSDWHAPRLRLINGRWLLVGVHEGIDIAAEQGTPVLAMEAGVVENTGWTFYSGTRVGVRGRDGRYYFYAHFSEVSPGIDVGTAVAAGQMLGRVGNTGYGPPGHRDEFPPHLHFGIESGAEWVDPYGLLVDLYAATVGADRQGEAALDQLGATGTRWAWERAAAALYMPAPLPSGE
jgi:murein DD-endopeptidase MepM/ murein hydrolase activator NlpD